jgi:lysyl-tRNA synthetase class 2
MTLANRDESDRFEHQRHEKLAEVQQMGLDPYGGRYEDVEPAESARARFKDGDESQRARCAGRIVLLRDIGKLIFITLRDRTGTIQVGLAKNLVGEQWRLAKLLDLGDIIGAEGKLGKTKTGEITIWVEENGLTLLSKCLCQPPEKFHGLADVDQRYRQRYVDLWANPEVLDRFKKRSAIVGTIRQFLEARGFIEVETPMMQAIAGGAAAKPFITHHNTLDLDLYLRISPELFLKRLLVGGMERVFEINRNFRNEGLSRQHNPEFTMIEVYQAYGDYHVMMDLTEELVGACLASVGAGPKVQFGDVEIDFTRPWRRAKYADLLAEYSGCRIDDLAAIRAKAEELQIESGGLDDAVLVNEVFEATVEHHLIAPTFVIDYPAAICPLTKRSKKDPQRAERFELFVAGMELANAYTELNDPAVQCENFRHQLRGQEESFTKMDMDFVTALKFGMPPAGGLGIGIDRLVMVLTGATTIRDVVLFPLLKPVAPEQA